VLFVIPFLAGSGDVLAVLLNVSVETITRILRYALVIALVLTWLVAFWVCRWLRATPAQPGHPHRGCASAAHAPWGVRDHLAGLWSSGRYVSNLPGPASSR
jgi:hypothetical protein